MSTRENYEQALRRYQEAGDAFVRLCPQQTEMLTDEHWVMWETSRFTSKPDTTFHLRCSPDISAATPAAFRRLADIRQSLEAWLRNEAPWPLSANPPPKENR
jgi:hypothetical protein